MPGKSDNITERIKTYIKIRDAILNGNINKMSIYLYKA